MTKEELKERREMLLSIAEQHGVMRDEFDNLYWKDESVTYRIKLKRNKICQERHNSFRGKWIRLNSYHIKRINLEKWDSFMTDKSFNLGDVL